MTDPAPDIDEGVVLLVRSGDSTVTFRAATFDLWSEKTLRTQTWDGSAEYVPTPRVGSFWGTLQ
jgi:hypothetical protein